MYQVGEYVIYNDIGICVVENIGKLCFSEDKEKLYYTLRPLNAHAYSRYYVPVNTHVFMRNAITKQEAFQYLIELKGMKTKPYMAKRMAQLMAYYDELLIKHNIIDYLRLYKELCQKEKCAKESGKKLGRMESDLKVYIEKNLVSEFAYALSESPVLSKKRLYEALCLG